MLTPEMIDTARSHGVELGKTAAAALRIEPGLAPRVDRLATAIVEQFSAIMTQKGLSEEDIAALCQTLREAYAAELPAGDGTRH